MKSVYSIVLIFSVMMAHAQPKPSKLVVRGDDMGYTHSGNDALIKCYKEGFETSIEILVPSPWFPEAAKLLQENPGIDVGIHLDLSSEWENIKWRPLTDCPSLRDGNGYFFPMIFTNKNYVGESLSEHAWKIEEVEKEFRAQIELALKYIPRISHLSAHMGCTNLSPAVRALTIALAKEYKIPVDPELDYQLMIGYDGPHKTPEEKVQSFIKMLDKLEPGKSYIFLDHPGLDNDELQAVYHIGYEGVAADRQGVTDLFTNEKVKALIKRKGLLLVGYAGLKN